MRVVAGSTVYLFGIEVYRSHHQYEKEIFRGYSGGSSDGILIRRSQLGLMDHTSMFTMLQRISNVSNAARLSHGILHTWPVRIGKEGQTPPRKKVGEKGGWPLLRDACGRCHRRRRSPYSTLTPAIETGNAFSWAESPLLVG